MKNNQKGFIAPILLAIIALLVISGGVYIYQNKKVEAPTPIDNTETQQSNQIEQQTNIQTSPVNTQTNNLNSQTDISNWKTYKNEKYGFEVKYPKEDNYNVAEFKPSTSDTFLSKINIFRNDGSFGVEIVIEKNIEGKADALNLRKEIMRGYGVSKWPYSFPTIDATIKEFSIEGHSAVKSNYVAKGEGSVSDPAVQIFVSDSQYIYKINYIGDTTKGDQIFSTFKFTK